jgi:glycosyltransferase involved in cell wall biosynthesis
MVESEIGLLTGGSDRPYALGLASALASSGISLDFIGSDQLDSPMLRERPELTFLNLRGSQQEDAGVTTKVLRVLMYYARLIRYAATARPRLFHILWNNKFEFFDRTLLMLFYKLLRKKIVLTAHNINAGRRDSNDSALNRLTLWIQYHLADHIFVHTGKMKTELLEGFGVREEAITVIPFGINNSVPRTGLTREMARRRLGIAPDERVMLFFGHIGPYKGLEFLVAAFHRLAAEAADYRLIIAGQPLRGSDDYFAAIERAIDADVSSERVVRQTGFVPDEETELYFKATDLLVLPYTEVAQSGVLVLGYSFGVPVVAADVGSLREDIVEGRTGFLCKPADPVDLAETISRYFRSDLFMTPDERGAMICNYARDRYSWDAVSRTTSIVYKQLLAVS